MAAAGLLLLLAVGDCNTPNTPPVSTRVHLQLPQTGLEQVA